MQAAVLAGLVLLAGCTQEPPALPLLPTDGVLLAFGDSLTYGTGAQRNQSYPAVLAQRIGHEVINAGIPGETTAEGLRRLPELLDETRPDLMLLCLGGNDFLRRYPVQRIRANLERMIELVLERDISLVLLEVPQAKLIVRPHPLYKELGEAYDVPVVRDAFSDVLGESGLRSDRIHPNAAGYARVAGAVADLLRQAGAI